jgi:hypothetical protein
VRVIDDLLNVDVDNSIVSLSLNLQAPENIQIELSTIKNDLSDLFGNILNVQDISNSVATQIGAGQVTVLGTFVVKDWVTGGTTTIDGDNITAGTITTSKLDFTPVDSDNIVATINASEEGLDISGNLIAITGETTFAAGYDPSGKIATGGAASDVNNNVTTISGGKITTNTIEANKLSTSTLSSRTITLSGSDAIIKGDYSAGSSGWKIDGNGNAEFNDVTIRGELAACTISSGNSLDLIGSIFQYENSTDTYPVLSLTTYDSQGRIIFRDPSSGSVPELQIGRDSIIMEADDNSGLTIDRDDNYIAFNDTSGNITIIMYGKTGKAEFKGGFKLPVGTNKY